MEKIRLGIIGLGRLGRMHAENIAHRIPTAELTAVCSIDQQELDAAHDLSAEYYYQNYHELLHNPKLDGVLIASNSMYHCEMALAAIEAGVKNIYLEKPLGMSLQEAQQIKASAERHQIPLFQVGYNRRFDQSYQDMKHKLDAGFIGTPISARMINRDPASLSDFIVKFSPTSGGLVFDMLTHDYDLLRWLLGCDAQTVYGLGGVYAYKDLMTVGDIDNCNILCRFENGTMASFETTRNCPYGYHVETEIFGTEGCLRMGINPNNDRVVYMNSNGITNTCTTWFYEYWEPTFIAEVSHFVDCIRNGNKPLVGLLDGYKAVEWALLASDAVREQQVIKLR